QLESISKWIVDVDAVVARQLIVVHLEAGVAKPLHQRPQIPNEKRRVGLPCRTKLWIDTQMDLHIVVFEPYAATRGQLRGLRRFRDSQDAAVELPTLFLTAYGHGELDMVDTDDRHCRHPPLEDRSRAGLSEPGWTILASFRPYAALKGLVHVTKRIADEPRGEARRLRAVRRPRVPEDCRFHMAVARLDQAAARRLDSLRMPQ